MTIRPFLVALLFACGLALAQEGEKPPEGEPPTEKPAEPAEAPEEKAPEGVSFTSQEIQNFMATFEQTYKNKDLPQEDAVSTLTNLKNAYLYLKSKGDRRTKEEVALQKQIVALIAKKGLFARKRGLVNLSCAQVLGEIGDPEGAGPLVRYLETILEEKSPNPQAVEYAFQSLAWIGPDDKGTVEMVLDYASKGKHQDMTVAAQAIKACYQWRELDAKTRKDFFEKIFLYLEGLHSKARSGEPKQRGLYDKRYKEVEADGLVALSELAGGGAKFDDPDKWRAWYNDNKKRKWEPYVGPKFRTAAAEKPKEGEEKPKEGEDAKPEG